MPASTFETFYVLDFDRTLADSDKLLEVFISVTNQYIDLPLEQVEKIDADVKSKGDSFDTATYVRDQLASQDASDQWKKLEKQFIHESRSLNMLMPGAAELLSFLDSRGDKYGVLTYGNPLWQHLKLAASGFNHVRRIVTTDKYKGMFIMSWQQESQFHLPLEFGGGIVDRVVLVDDKAMSFVGFPGEPSKGYHVLDPAVALPAQLGEIPQQVTQVATLQDVVSRL